MNVSRRQLIQSGVGTLASGIFGSSAGCLQQTPLSTADDVSIPEPKRPTYRRWLPNVETVESVTDYAVRYESVAELRASTIPEDHKLTDWLVTRRLDGIEKRWDDFGLTLDDIEDIITLDGTADWASPSPRAYVVQGSYDPEEVGSTLAKNGFSTDETYRGYRVYRRNSPPRATGVSDTAVVHVRSTNPGSFLRRIVDAKQGDVPRRHETDGDFELLTEEVGQPTVGTMSRREGTPEPNPDHLLFDGGVGTGKAWLIEGSTVYARYVLPFRSESKAETDRVREVMDDEGKFDNVEVYGTGRVVFVEAESDLGS